MALLSFKKFCSIILNPTLAPIQSPSQFRCLKYLSVKIGTPGWFNPVNKFFELKKHTTAQHQLCTKSSATDETRQKQFVGTTKCVKYSKKCISMNHIYTTKLNTPMDSRSVRYFATSSKTPKTKDDKAKEPVQEGLCPTKVTKPKPKEKSKKSWSFFSSKQEQKEKDKDCLEDCCEFVKVQTGPDPDFRHLDGTIYKSCGQAYLLQKEKVSRKKMSDFEMWENNLVDRIERHPDLKNVEDPMPEFQSVGQRLVDLADKKLHPLYKKYMMTPKPPRQLPTPKHLYKSISGPIKPDDIPSRFKFNKECLDRKNIYADFKRVEPPRQLLAKILEIQLNEKPTMEKKIKNQNKKQ
ncbi:uncharacterized protein [Diabrotica undecimpunctata]|uniref:uncharacterized protein n=1 Tax=Diabrotica undecimpunctata TaxID=50387 RepID=UPI003B6415FB